MNGTFLGALALDRMGWLGQDGTTQTQVGDLDTYNHGAIRALRFGLVGTFNFKKPWIYTFAAATHAFDKGFDTSTTDKIGIFDVRLDIPLFRDTSIAIGKQKEPISMERLTPMVNLPMQERSAVSDAMMPSRNTGIVLSGTGFDRRTTWAGGAFNSWLDQNVSIEKAASQLIGRGTWLAHINKNENSLIHVDAGARFTNAKQGGQYRSEPEFNQSPVFVDTYRHIVLDDQNGTGHSDGLTARVLLMLEKVRVGVKNESTDLL
ncbi:MAG: porin [Pontiella sp.]